MNRYEFLRRNYYAMKCPICGHTAFFISNRFSNFFEFYVCDYRSLDQAVISIACPNGNHTIGVGLKVLFDPMDLAS